MRRLHPPFVCRQFVTLSVLGTIWLATGDSTSVAGELSRAGDAQRVLELAREVCESVPADVDVTFRRGGGMWRTVGVECWFGPPGVTDAAAKELARLATIESLQLRDHGLAVGATYPLSTTGLRVLVPLRGLRSLSVPWDRIDAEFETLCAFTRLERLDLYGGAPLKKITIDDLDRLRRELPSLRQLNVRYSGLDDESLDPVVAIRGLEGLTLASNSGVTDAGAAKLRALGNLRTLSVDSLGPRGLSAMSEMLHLEHLSIDGYTPVPDNADLSVLSGLEWLTFGVPFGSDQPTKVRLPVSLRRLDIWNQDVENLDVQLSTHIEQLQVEVRISHSIFHRERTALDTAWLRSLRELREITLIDPVEQDVKAIAGLTSLRALTLQTLEYSGVEDEGMRLLAPLRQLESLTVVDYCTGQVGNRPIDEGLDVLLKLSALRRLSLSGFPRVTAKGLDNVWKLTQLRTLRLDLFSDSCPLIDDEALAHVSAMRDLEELSIGRYGGTISDKGIRALASLKRLRRLELGRLEGYSDEALASLMTDLPNLQEVTRSYSERKVESEAEQATDEEQE